MLIRMFLRAISLTLLSVTLVFGAERIKYNVSYKHKCLESDSLIDFLLKISLQQCVRECSLRPKCLSINYRRSKLLCELYSEDDGIFVKNNVNTGPCVFVRKTSFEPQAPVDCPTCSVEETCVETSTCARKECPKLTLNKGTIFGNLQAVGSRVKFSCDEKYMEVENRKYTTCEENGQWSYVPRCITTSCSTLSTNDRTGSNVAKHKTVNLSSILEELDGHLMVDGKYEQDMTKSRCCSHTKNTDDISYAIVDLGAIYTINSLYILNRVDSETDRLRNVSITIGESMEDLRLHVYMETQIGPTCTFLIVQPCRGRFLKIWNVRGEPLTICEFEVYGELYSP